MFEYSDPGKTLRPESALANYRLALHLEYGQSARLANSAFTVLEAFDEVPLAKKQIAGVEWSAFPRAAAATNAEIDAGRFRFQDEYVEWAVTRTAGAVRGVTFTTEFLAYYEALARVGPSELISAIQDVIPGAAPKASELFGGGFDAGTASENARAARFIAFAQRNPWINGQKGILCLAHQSSTLAALFRLVDAAAIPNTAVPAGAICEALGGNCVGERNSDPNIAAAVQGLARNDRSLTLVDPAGIEISGLTGIWRIGNRILDINDQGANDGIWSLTRGNKRGVLSIPPNLFLDDQPVVTGAQVAAALRVKSSVISAVNADLPEWSRLGREGSTRLGQLTDGGVL